MNPTTIQNPQEAIKSSNIKRGAKLKTHHTFPQQLSSQQTMGQHQQVPMPIQMSQPKTRKGTKMEFQQSPTLMYNVSQNMSNPVNLPQGIQMNPLSGGRNVPMQQMGGQFPNVSGVPSPYPHPVPQATPTQPSSTPLSTLLALYSITQLPTSTPQIQEIIRRKDTPEAQKVEDLKKVIQEYSKRPPPF